MITFQRDGFDLPQQKNAEQDQQRAKSEGLIDFPERKQVFGISHIVCVNNSATVNHLPTVREWWKCSENPSPHTLVNGQPHMQAFLRIAVSGPPHELFSVHLIH